MFGVMLVWYTRTRFLPWAPCNNTDPRVRPDLEAEGEPKTAEGLVGGNDAGEGGGVAPPPTKPTHNNVGYTMSEYTIQQKKRNMKLA